MGVFTKRADRHPDTGTLHIVSIPADGPYYQGENFSDGRMQDKYLARAFDGTLIDLSPFGNRVPEPEEIAKWLGKLLQKL